MDIKKIVNSLVKKHKTRNPFEIIKGLNVILVPVPLEGVRGYKQEEAAKLIGIATDTLRNYEQGKSYPDIPVLRKIEETYNVRYSQIIFLPLDFGLTEIK